MTKEELIAAKIKMIIDGTKHMLWVLLESIPLSAVVAFIVWFILSRLEDRFYRLAEKKRMAVGLSFYLTLIVQMGILLRPFGSERGFVWVPFKTGGGLNMVVLFALANALVFVPFGVLLPKVFSKVNTWWKVALITLLISLIIETLQYVLACGMSEIEDLIMNVAGAVFGFVLAKNTDAIRNKRENESEQ